MKCWILRDKISDSTSRGRLLRIPFHRPYHWSWAYHTHSLIFNCEGDFADQSTHLGETQNGLQYKYNLSPEFPVQGVFSLKYLILFTKCTNLCNQIQLYIKNDYPLIIQYTIASLGMIKLCLAPITDNS